MKICENQISGKLVVSRINKKFLKFKHKADNPFKNGYKLYKHLTKKDISMAKKYRKKYSTLLTSIESKLTS